MGVEELNVKRKRRGKKRKEKDEQEDERGGKERKHCVVWVSRTWGKVIYEAVGAREAELTGLQEGASVRDGREKDDSARKRALDQW